MENNCHIGIWREIVTFSKFIEFDSRSIVNPLNIMFPGDWRQGNVQKISVDPYCMLIYPLVVQNIAITPILKNESFWKKMFQNHSPILWNGLYSSSGSDSSGSSTGVSGPRDMKKSDQNQPRWRSAFGLLMYVFGKFRTFLENTILVSWPRC